MPHPIWEVLRYFPKYITFHKQFIRCLSDSIKNLKFDDPNEKEKNKKKENKSEMMKQQRMRDKIAAEEEKGRERRRRRPKRRWC